ncbi:MAG: trigger factor [Coriobacteriales bacterium]|jgi:trigger factor|nr:trigger factor [Coriobacteriales bacterium]
MATLETTSKRSDEDKIELTVTIPASEAQSAIDASYKKAGKARIPGFRPGKAPRRVLENYYGGKEYFQAQATDELLKKSLPLAIDAEGHVPLSKPEITELDLIEEGKDYCFTATFPVRPQFELSSYGPVQIELPSEEPTPEEIDQRVDVMLGYYIDFEDVTDRAVQGGDYLTLGMEITRDGQRIEGLSGEDLPYQLESGGMPASFDENLLGMEIGETREFDFLIPSQNAEEEGDEGKPMHVVATVKGIRTGIKPELTDAWVKEKIEFDSVDEFKGRIADSIRTQKQSDLAALRERLISEELALRLQGEPPSVLVAQTEQSVYRDFFTSLQQSGRTLDDFLASMNVTFDAFREDVKRQAIEITAQGLALDALARHLAYEATDDEVREEFASIDADDPEGRYQQWKEDGRLSEIREGLLRMKAARYINENAEVFEPGKKPAAKKAATKKAAGKKAAAAKDAGAGKGVAGKGAAGGKEAGTDAEASAEKATTRKKAASKAKSTGKKSDGEEAANETKPASDKVDAEN